MYEPGLRWTAKNSFPSNQIGIYLIKIVVRCHQIEKKYLLRANLILHQVVDNSFNMGKGNFLDGASDKHIYYLSTKSQHIILFLFSYNGVQLVQDSRAS